ncbi:hypothetical protein E2C01_072227 [Portunus trituberculatus]|uniref:Uncharacterized protein n=1 Tax=Portunus trituberculatus TaxID=210409 RepID=A0A5B7HXF4_PORTR|nr:hypothetical protein [Portunus trituberculatus]
MFVGVDTCRDQCPCFATNNEKVNRRHKRWSCKPLYPRTCSVKARKGMTPGSPLCGSVMRPDSGRDRCGNLRLWQ